MKPLYKVGDKVEIITREAEPSAYRFGFTDGMTEYSGQVVTIISIKAAVSGPKSIPDDDHRYNILEDQGHYKWASSMFRPLVASIMSQSRGDTPMTIKIKVKTNQPKFNFKN